MSGKPTTTPEQKRRYNKSPKGRARTQRYLGSLKGRIAVGSSGHRRHAQDRLTKLGDFDGESRSQG